MHIYIYRVYIYSIYMYIYIYVYIYIIKIVLYLLVAAGQQSWKQDDRQKDNWKKNDWKKDDWKKDNVKKDDWKKDDWYKQQSWKKNTWQPGWEKNNHRDGEKQYEENDKEKKKEGEGKGKGPDYLGHYAVLGLTTAATKGEIVASYRKLALKTHPDKQGIDETLRKAATVWFQRVKEAHAVLSDEEKRAKYDEACVPKAEAEDTSKAPTDKAHEEACADIVGLPGWVVFKSRSTGSCYFAQPMLDHVQWASPRLYPYVATDNCSCAKCTAAFPK